MRKLLSAAALCLALPLILSLSGCGAAVDERSFNPTSNNTDGSVAEGSPDAAEPTHIGFITDPASNGSGSGSTQTPSAGSGSGSAQSPSTGAGSGSTQTPSTGSGAGSTQTPSTGSGSGSTQVPSTGSGSTTPPSTGSGPTQPTTGSSGPVEVDPGSGTASLAWTPPTTNVDGSPLTELAGYAVAYGRSSGLLDQLITVNDARATGYTVEGLEPGVWYFSVRALAIGGMESASSNIATTQID